MVETYLAAVTEPPSPAKGAAPVLFSVRGILKNADINHYRKHLAAKISMKRILLETNVVLDVLQSVLLLQKL
jgi:hypothetical protein